MSGAPIKTPSEPAAPKPLMSVVSPVERVSGRPENDFKTQPFPDFGPTVFQSEAQLARATALGTRRQYLRKVGAVLVVSAIAGLGAWFGWQAVRGPKTASAAVDRSVGTAIVNSSPVGAKIIIDGIARGTTPVRLSLSAG